MDKNEFRSQLRSQRNRLTAQFIQENSAQVIHHILQSPLWSHNKHIAIYLPFNGEVDLTALLHEQNKHIYLPSIDGTKMQFQRLTPGLSIKTHQFGIQQPEFIHGLKPAPLELCLLPLLGFDLKGHRLGMGGGYYDRYFENDLLTTLAGVAYEFQHIDQLPTDSWDVKLRHIFTEQGLYTT